LKKVLVTQPIPDERLAALGSHCTVETLQPSRSLSDAPDEQLAGCHGLFCLLTDPVTRSQLERMVKLEFVSSVSVGVDHIDVQALSERGIPLGNTPGVLVDATADLALSLLLAAARRVAEGDRFIRDGLWTSCWRAATLSACMSLWRTPRATCSMPPG
jgi:glyoxylate reductase